MDERDNFHVPYDIVRNILVRLPVKSLLRLKTVSKAYSILISDPKFVSSHLYRSKTLGPQNMFVQKGLDWDGQLKLIRIKNHRCRVVSGLRYPSEEYGPSLTLCGCDGLLAFLCCCPPPRDDSVRMLFLLYNPSIRTFQQFWSPCGLDYRGPLYFGLCYDPLIEDYKFVVTDMEEYSAVFYCRNKYWIEREESLFDGKIDGCENASSKEGVCFHAALHWLLYDHNQHCYEIVCFSSRDHKYRVMQKPESLRNHTHGYWRMDLFGGNLCLSHCSNHNSVLQILTLKKHDDRDIWIEFITIELPREPMFFRWASPVLLPKENEIILHGRKIYAVYNVSERTFKELETGGMFLNSIPYVENLFAMEE